MTLYHIHEAEINRKIPKLIVFITNNQLIGIFLLISALCMSIYILKRWIVQLSTKQFLLHKTVYTLVVQKYRPHRVCLIVTAVQIQ